MDYLDLRLHIMMLFHCHGSPVNYHPSAIITYSYLQYLFSALFSAKNDCQFSFRFRADELLFSTPFPFLTKNVQSVYGGRSLMMTSLS